MPTLIDNNGTQAGRRHDLSRKRYVLGRHPDCDIVIDVGAVSRHHAQLLRTGNEYVVEDMNSRNGTFVNDQMIFGQHQLKNGDQIRVCDIAFTYNCDDEDSTSELPSHTAVLVDDVQESSVSTIMSKLDVSSDSGSVRYVASPEAKLTALLEIARRLGRSLSLDQVLPQLLNSLFKVFLQADRGFIVLQGAGGELIPRWTKLRHETRNETIRISRTIINEVMRSEKAILSADAAADSRFDMSESIADFHIRSMMCAPLINSEGEAIGALQIDTNDQRNRFRQEDLEVLASVAVQAAIAIENAQLHESLIQQRELERDLTLAREVQKSFLPTQRPTIPNYVFFDYYEPANHVGGDYYDYVPLPDSRWAIVIGDVVGHGVAAALMMSKLSASVRFGIASESSPAGVLTKLNRKLTDNFDGRFITLAVVVLDPNAHEALVSLAGHMPPLIRRAATGQIEEIGTEQKGMPLLIDPDATFQQSATKLEPGDCLLVYTDGITEAMSEGGELYGEERLKAQINDTRAAQVGQQIIDNVKQFMSGQPSKDDMCLLCLSREPTPNTH